MPYTFPQAFSVPSSAGLSVRVQDDATPPAVLASFVVPPSGRGTVSLTVSDTSSTVLYLVRVSDSVILAGPQVFDPREVASLQKTSAVDVAAAVWGSSARTLTSFGTLVSDIVAGVWGATTRTLSAFGFAVGLTPDERSAVRSGLSTHSPLDVWNVSQNASFLPNTLGAKLKLWLLDSLGRVLLSRTENVLTSAEPAALALGRIEGRIAEQVLVGPVIVRPAIATLGMVGVSYSSRRWGGPVAGVALKATIRGKPPFRVNGISLEVLVAGFASRTALTGPDGNGTLELYPSNILEDADGNTNLPYAFTSPEHGIRGLEAIVNAGVELSALIEAAEPAP